MSTQHDEQSTALRGFPGGRPRLPRLNRPAKLVDDEDAATEAEDAEPTATTATATEDGQEVREVDGTFFDYFTTESLFGSTDEARAAEDGDETAAAYAVLGLTRQASWKEVTRAHRELVAMLHPDRYVDADDDLREAAERWVRDVNEAYALLRKQRSPQRA